MGQQLGARKPVRTLKLKPMHVALVQLIATEIFDNQWRDAIESISSFRYATPEKTVTRVCLRLVAVDGHSRAA